MFQVLSTSLHPDNFKWDKSVSIRDSLFCPGLEEASNRVKQKAQSSSPASRGLSRCQPVYQACAARANSHPASPHIKLEDSAEPPSVERLFLHHIASAQILILLHTISVGLHHLLSEQIRVLMMRNHLWISVCTSRAARWQSNTEIPEPSHPVRGKISPHPLLGIDWPFRV